MISRVIPARLPTQPPTQSGLDVLSDRSTRTCSVPSTGHNPIRTGCPLGRMPITAALSTTSHNPIRTGCPLGHCILARRTHAQVTTQSGLDVLSDIFIDPDIVTLLSQPNPDWMSSRTKRRPLHVRQGQVTTQSGLDVLSDRSAASASIPTGHNPVRTGCPIGLTLEQAHTSGHPSQPSPDWMSSRTDRLLRQDSHFSVTTQSGLDVLSDGSIEAGGSIKASQPNPDWMSYRTHRYSCIHKYSQVTTQSGLDVLSDTI